MITDELWSAIKRLVQDIVSTQPYPKRGLVSSVDPTTMHAKVQLSGALEDGITNWLPLAMPCIGPGWGLIVSPPIGAQVLITPTEGDSDAAVVVGAHWSNQQQVPSGYQVGEFWFLHKNGQYVKVFNSGNVEVKDQFGTVLTLTNNGNVVVQGTLLVTGAIIAGFGGGDQVGLQTHTHDQPPDSHGDSEQTTNAPNAGS